MRILVTGSAGYVGAVLVPKLLAADHDIEYADIGWFDQTHNTDFRSIKKLSSFDAVIHLAAVANDPTGDLNPELTWETNALGTMQLAQRSVESGVRQFIYASSGSVYGVSDDPQVTELSTLNPISAYNKTKMVAERCLMSYADKMAVQIIRPATVCGLSPRMRLDTAVNALTMQALTRGVIEVHGGQQYRPNIHIEDMTDLYLFMLDHPEHTGIWNAGFENLTLLSIAEKVAKRTKAEIRIVGESDPRSYRMNSDKLLATGFKPKRSVSMAIAEIEIAVRNGQLKDEPIHYNLKRMKELGL